MAQFFDVLAAKKEGYSDQEIADFLAQQNNFDAEAARKEGYKNSEIITELNKTNQGAGFAFLKNFGQSVGSEIKGLYQLGGGELSTIDESLARQLAAESPIASGFGTFLGSIVNPTTALPVVGTGAKAVGLSTAAAGGIAGLLDPTYEDSESRLLTGAVGFTIGGVLGALLGALGAKGQVAKELGDALIKKAQEAGAKTEAEIAEWISKNGAKEAKTAEATVQPTPKAEAVNAPVVESMDSVVPFKPFIEQLDSTNPQARQTFEEAILKGSETGDYSDVIKTYKDYTTEYEFGKSPLWKIKDILSEDNPFYAKNLEALRELGFEQRANSFKVMQNNFNDINFLRQVDPADVAPVPELIQQWMNRGVGEIFDVRQQQAIAPWLEKQLDEFSNLDLFYKELLQSGVPEREALTLIRDSISQFATVTSQVLGNRSQAGRVLGDKSTTKMFGSLRGFMKMIESGKANSFDDEMALNLVDSINKLRIDSASGAVDFKKAASELAAKTVEYKPTTGQKFSELITNIYTSGLQTAAVNAWSPPIKMLLNGIENTLLTLTPGSSRFLDFKRSAASFSALLDSFKEATYFAKAGFLEGKSVSQPGSMEDIAGAIGKHMVNGVNVSPKLEQKVGQAVRMIGSNPSVGIDEFFKTYFRKMSLYDSYHQLAYSGKFKGREQEVYNQLKKIDTSGRTWTEKLSSVNIEGISKTDLKAIAQKAIDYAKLNTFQADLGKLGNDLLRLKSNNPAAAVVIPFVKTPINILKEGLSYTPLGLLPGVTPQKVVRKNGRIVRDAAGKPLIESYLSKEQKYARAAMGVAAATMIGLHVANNEITGAYPRDAGKRAAMQAAGIPEYSLKIGDKWIPYGRIEPLATSLGMVVDSMNRYRDLKEKNPKDIKDGEYAKNVIGVLASSFVNKTFLQGLSGALQALNNPEQYGDSYIKGFASLAVPGVVAQFAKASDPFARVTTDFKEAVLNRLPGQREQLPVQYDLIGAPVANPSQGVAAFTGLPIRSTSQTPVQAKLQELKIDYAPVEKTFGGVQLTGEQFSRLQQLSGEAIERKLEKLVAGGAFEGLPEARQRYLITQRLQEARKIANNKFKAEMIRDPEFRAELIRQKRMKKGLEE